MPFILSQGSRSGLDTEVIWEALDPEAHVTPDQLNPPEWRQGEARVDTHGSVSTDSSDALLGRNIEKKICKRSLFPHCLILESSGKTKQPVNVQPILTGAD